MDNLKFACELNDVKGNETGETTDDQILIIYTYNRLDIKYLMSITDYNKIQYPKVFLLPSACIDVIIEQVRSTILPYTYDQQTDTVNIIMEVFGKCSLRLTLSKDLSSTLGAEARISRLEITLQSLIDYEIIEQHVYPTWSTYEQFKELPTYRYFAASDNIRSMYKEIPVSHFGQVDGIYYQMTNVAYGFGGECDKYFNRLYYKDGHFAPCANIDQFAQTVSQYRTYLDTLSICEKTYNYSTTDVKFYELYDATNPKTPQIEFSNSLDIKSYKFKIQQPVIAYIAKYVFGWFLTNSQLCFARKIKLDIVISNNVLTINILRSKQLQMPFIEYTPTYMRTHIMLPVLNSIKYDKYLINYL